MILKTKKEKKDSSVTTTITTTEKGNTSSAKSLETLDFPSANRYSVPYEESTMKGLFFILRGQYRSKKHIVVVEGEEISVGGYDPTDSSNKEWYMVMDKVVFHCIYCGSDLKKAQHSIKQVIERYKDTPKKYFKDISTYSSEDYYEVHYKHKRPLTIEELNDKAEGRTPRTSPAMWKLYMSAYLVYGDYYSSIVEEAEDEALEVVKDLKNPVLRNGKMMKKLRKKEEPLFNF